MWLRIVICFLFFGGILNVFSQTGALKGRVVNVRTNEVIVAAIVQVEGTNNAVMTNEEGEYEFKNLSPGFYHLLVSSLGFEKQRTSEVQVLGKQVSFLDISMEESNVLLNEAVVRPNLKEKKAESPLSVKTLEVQQIEKSAGVNRDVSKLVQTLPGVASTVANRNDLLVRGGGPAENVFYLDGVELPVINHFSTQGAAGGVVGIVNPDFVNAVDFYTGAFPANRLNALSSVMDIRMKDGSRDRLHTKLALGASDASLTLDGPINARSTFIFSARQSYLQALFKLLDLPFLPTYNDFQLKYDYRFTEKRNLSIIALASIDKMRLNTELAESGNEGRRYLLNYLPVYDQWHYTIGAVYKVLGAKHTDRWILSRNMLNNGSYKHLANDEQQPKLFDYCSTESENKFRFERIYWGLPVKLNLGAGVQHAHYTNQTERSVRKGAKFEREQYDAQLDLFTYFAFAQASKDYWANRLKLSLGVNLVGNTYNRFTRNPLRQLSPRFSASYALNSSTDISANVGRYAKLPSYTTLGYKDAEGNYPHRMGDLKYIMANHFVVGLDHRFSSALSVVVEGFYKSYENYPISRADGISLAAKGAEFEAVGDEAVTASGKGRAYGGEMVARLTLPQGVSFTTTYTLFRSEFTDISGRYLPSSWDTGHIINFTGSVKLPRHWNFAARWRWVGSAPYSPIDWELSTNKAAWNLRNRAYLDFSRFNTLRLAPAHQLDLRLDKDFYFGRYMLNVYVDVQNAYKASVPQVPIYTNLDAKGQIMTDPVAPERQQLRQIESLGGTILPTIGLMMKF